MPIVAAIWAIALGADSQSMPRGGAVPEVELTVPQAGASVSVSHPWVITWSARDIPANAMLSLRIRYVDHTTVMILNGQRVVPNAPAAPGSPLVL